MTTTDEKKQQMREQVFQESFQLGQKYFPSPNPLPLQTALRSLHAASVHCHR